MARARDDRGVALPSPLVILSIVAVAMAGITFLATNTDDTDGGMSTVSQPDVTAAATPTPTPEPTKAPAPKVTKKQAPEIDRSKVYVEVYNKSNVAGLAGTTSTRATDAGWQVVGTDNWFGGNIPASTVYYPTRLKAEAKLLAKDLGIERSVPAVDPMRGDRLTVILTADYAG
jgi:hypothetical protein